LLVALETELRAALDGATDDGLVLPPLPPHAVKLNRATSDTDNANRLDCLLEARNFITLPIVIVK
jgi:hypothetical protein